MSDETWTGTLDRQAGDLQLELDESEPAAPHARLTRHV